MRRLTLLPLLLSLAALGCRHGDSGAERDFDPERGDSWFVGRYTPEGTYPPTFPACASTMGRVEVLDPRPDPLTVGQRYHEQRPGRLWSIKMQGAPAEWIKDALVSNLRRAAAQVGTAGRPTLRVKVRLLDLQEKVFSNSNYEARVVLDAELMGGSAAPCWTGSAEGNARNYGRAGSQDNYQETANHALDKAVYSLLSEDGLRDALCGKCTGAPANAGPATL